MDFPSLPDWFWYPIAFVYGAIVGSFLNVVIYRLPLQKSVWGGGSYCPNCHTFLKPWDNIPILGFLLLGGKCRYCRTPISWRYISVELLTGCLWLALFHRISGVTSISWFDFIFQALFASVLVAMVFIDLDHFIAPDELNRVGFLLALGRDITCLVIAFKAGSYVWEELWPRFAYFHFLPRALPGALAYGGLLFAVSVIGFVYYAREEGETAAQALRRYFTFVEDLPEATEAPVEALVGEPAGLPPAIPQVGDFVEESEEDEPPRLRLSPGFTAAIAAALMATVAGFWGLLALLVPAVSFVLLARRNGETAGAALRRFFQPDEDDNYSRVDNDQLAAEEEADTFARETETGAHGGMGLGDVKLALAIGGLLGPVLSMLSLFVATLLGAITGIAIRGRRRNLRYGIPFVPFMAAGAIVTMLYGANFVQWYVGLFTPPDRTQSAPRPVNFGRPHRPRRTVTPPTALP